LDQELFIGKFILTFRVKAESHSVNTSWNFGMKHRSTMEHAMKRYEINKGIQFRSLVPMLTLMMDILNKELVDLDDDFITYCYPIMSSAIIESINKFEEYKKQLSAKNPFSISLMKEPDVI
jgi:hypothetical protein